MLECVHQGDWAGGQFPALCRQLEGMPALQHLAIRQAEWLPQRMPRLLAALAACRRLRSLHLVGCALTTEVLRDVRATAHVNVLDLRDDPKLFPGGAGAIVPEPGRSWRRARAWTSAGAGTGRSRQRRRCLRFERLRPYAGAAGPSADRAPGHGRGGCRLLGMLNGMRARHRVGGPPVEVALGALQCSIAGSTVSLEVDVQQCSPLSERLDTRI